MTRVKKATHALKYRRTVLKAAKGFRFGRSKKEAAAVDALMHAGAYAFAHRRDKKGDMRRLWNVKINAALRPLGFSYSKFIGAAKKKGIELDRKALAHLAEFKPEVFARVVAKVK
ncbi:MAG: 50S ribosomal protein L20 [Candidatus Taylorbacteria bacterium RIFCSPHIGHO2_02_FULL_45_28]|uniref:50S ribosomal protein L20 n=1 Tax=Candidatus Taylorbacteria bacterium RIFCSPHIGHO2_12_FULL_45_16 TaxID=1802315 RepID=A0A1G2N369_9BACT|nr:MAG: 50S ribosomal protein L20 [Candidatus Taylorbacteria bacterium RIFCSPHIGHO2_01_FULL_44_110]OHA25004.1 MAG: 50S ribosomal protein L20 [Candidatus Taylorbacteria bacterium RIFCSPHIGHO2_02_FULL_45_28]OHA29819.1 MAG: 50S ribosomal protein L20 [Candidatus Taylorbacteria bacterium RIFCSPHIGHO2_12_FULL_45_16]OHA32765.1 MAG: 50S ribosomal protein L20 [Candidatus Taylorbacteria bacterium RIFCSPLOWO2_01_FULL_45_59]OHA39850.1 MAG: 50S ribosomal protein L20 [Candidatus Taylorbacteria bacterium RIFC